MPVKSSSSSVLTWPSAENVVAAAAEWARVVTGQREDVQAVGMFGSYAAGRSGVGSDLDLVIIVGGSAVPFERRSASFDTTHLPVPVDLLVYTADEWARLTQASIGFGKTLREGMRWLVERREAGGER
jgi:uncharacterized protein